MSCSLVDRRSREILAGDLRARAFAGSPGDRCGAKVELVPLDTAARRIRPLHSSELGPGVAEVVRRHGAARGWREERHEYGGPRFRVPGGGFIAFEPGGQMEYAAPPHPTPSSLLADIRTVIEPLVDAAREAGLELAGVGIDPWTPLEQTSLQLHGDRYSTMHTYLSQRGPAGARMMLQTAAVQINLDCGPAGDLRWRTLNAIAPLLTAIFANAPIYASAPTGYASYRARQWRELDPARTGVLDGDAVEAYLEFALAAPYIFRRGPGGAWRSFDAWLLRGEVSMDAWKRHLTTLFPEVRPRGHLEVRSIDAQPPDRLAAPMVLLAGLTANAEAMGAALEIAGPPDARLLHLAARHGLAHEDLAGRARELFRLGLDAAEARGADVVASADLDAARDFYERYTRNGRAPADDALRAAA